MHISKLSIRNYRNFRNVSLDFQKGVNTILGENGSGKTNLFQGMRILIDESMPRNTRFYESDFNRSIGPWLGHWIVIQIEFEDLDSSDEAQSIAMHKVGVADEIDSSKGTYAVYFRPKIEIRRALFELSEDDDKNEDKLDEILSGISLNDYESVFAGKGNVDFSIEDNYEKYVGDFELMLFPDPDEEKTDVYGIKMYGVSIPNEFACTFAKALRDVESDLRSYKGNPLLSLLRDKEKYIKIEEKSAIEDQVEDLNNNISGLDEVKNISLGIGKTVKDTVGETYAPNINIKSELPSDMERLLQSLKLWVGDPDEEGYEGRLWELSLGGANLIYLSLKLLEFEMVKKPDKIANFILIEEPEAHIHTHIQKTLFQKLNKASTQIFISTHSTHISSVSKISSMNILGRSTGLAQVYNPSSNLGKKDISRLERYLDASRTNLLFAKGVILVEGDAEHILIPELVRRVLGISLDELGISLINIGSTGFRNVATLFHEDRVNRKCSILTDNDISIIELPKQEEEDDDFARKCRNSEISGIERKKKLDAFCEENTWLKSFYAKHTFEVDFLISGNSLEVYQIVEKEYKNAATKKKIKELLESKNIAIAGKEVLRLAEKFGKGWFSIMLSENVDNITEVPDYIIQAISFACPRIRDTTFEKMCLYRIEALTERHYESDTTDYPELLKKFKAFSIAKEAVDFYRKQMPKDVLSKLIRFKDA